MQAIDISPQPQPPQFSLSDIRSMGFDKTPPEKNERATCRNSDKMDA